MISPPSGDTTTAALPPEPARTRWLMLALAWWIYFGFSLTSTSLFPIVTPIRESLGISYGQIGVILGVRQLVYVFASLPVGGFIDRVGTKASLLIGIGIIAVSGLLRSISVDFITLLGAVALFGIGGPIVSVGLPKVIAGWFSGKERGTAAGIYVTGAHSGAVAALALTNSLVLPAVPSWRNVLQIYAGVMVLIGVAWLIFGRESPGFVRATGRGSMTTALRSYRRIAAIGGVWPIMIIGWSGFLANHGLRSWLPEILIVRGFDPATAGFIAAIPAVAGMVGSIVIARLAANRFRWHMIVGLLIALATTTGAVAVTDGAALVVVVILQGFCAAALLPLMLTVLMDMPEIGAVYVGGAAGLYFAVGEIGGFVGPSAVGGIVEWTGSFSIGIGMLAALILLMLIPAMQLRRRELYREE